MGNPCSSVGKAHLPVQQGGSPSASGMAVTSPGGSSLHSSAFQHIPGPRLAEVDPDARARRAKEFWAERRAAVVRPGKVVM